MLKEKPVFVLGSAPSAKLPENIDDYFVIASNASIAKFPDLTPDVLFLNIWTMIGKTKIAPFSRIALNNRKCKTIIVINGNNTEFSKIIELLKEIGIGYQSIQIWDKMLRSDYCTFHSGVRYFDDPKGDVVPSTGVTSICYALVQAESITVSGINIHEDGHNYHEDESFKRGHIEHDKFILDKLKNRIDFI